MANETDIHFLDRVTALPPHKGNTVGRGKSHKNTNNNTVRSYNAMIEHKDDMRLIGNIDGAIAQLSDLVVSGSTKKSRDLSTKADSKFKNKNVPVTPSAEKIHVQQEKEKPLCTFSEQRIFSVSDPNTKSQYFYWAFVVFEVAWVSIQSVVYFIKTPFWFIVSLWGYLIILLVFLTFGKNLVLFLHTKLRRRLEYYRSLKVYKEVQISDSYLKGYGDTIYQYQGYVVDDICRELHYSYLEQDMSKEANRRRALFEARTLMTKYKNSADITPEHLYNSVAHTSWKIIEIQNLDTLNFGRGVSIPWVGYA
jgi:hypothetical protein